MWGGHAGARKRREMSKQGEGKNGEWLCSEEQRNGGWSGRGREKCWPAGSGKEIMNK